MSLENDGCPRRRQGKTELSISVIPFGTKSFGDNFGFVNNEEAMALMRRAVDLGVNHFDCARCYGNSLSKLGRALQEGVIGRNEVIISGRICCHSVAQWGGYGDGRPDYSAVRVLADTEDQLGILGVQKSDVLFIHAPPEIEPMLVANGMLEGLEEARSRGMVDFIGYGMRPQDFHLAHIESGRTDALLCVSDYNLLRQSAADYILPASHAADLGVPNDWSIMRGWLTVVPIENFIPRGNWGEDQKRAEAMRLWCAERSVEMLELTLQFCLREDRIHVKPIGSLNVEQLEWNVRAEVSAVADVTIVEFTAADL